MTDILYNVYRKLASDDASKYELISSSSQLDGFSDTTCLIGHTYDYKVTVDSDDPLYSGESRSSRVYTSVDPKLSNVISQVTPYISKKTSYSTAVLTNQITGTGLSVVSGAFYIHRPIQGKACYFYKAGSNSRNRLTMTETLGTSDFTIEMRYCAVPGINGRIASLMNNTASSGSFLIDRTYDAATNTISVGIILGIGSSWTHYVTTGQIRSNKGETHICIQRKSGVLYIYFDGVLAGVSSPLSFNITSNILNISGWPNASSDHAPGVYGAFKITKGLCRYKLLGFSKSDINMELTTTDPYYDNVLLNFQPVTKTSLKDVSKYSIATTSVGSQWLVPEHNDARIYQDGASIISVPINDLGLSDFTIEFSCFYNGSWTTYPRLFEIGGPSAHYGQIVVLIGGSAVEMHVYKSGPAYESARIGDIQTGTDIKICYMRKNGIFYFYVNGVKTGTVDKFLDFSVVGTSLTIMSGRIADSQLYGSFKDVRVSNIARYDTSLSNIVQDEFQSIIRTEKDVETQIVSNLKPVSRLTFEDSSYKDSVDGVVWTTTGSPTIVDIGYDTSTKSLSLPASAILTRNNITSITGDFRLYVRFKYIPTTTATTGYDNLIYSNNFTIRLPDSGFGSKLQFSFDATSASNIYSTGLNKSFFMNDQWHTIELIRKNGEVRFYVSGIIYNLNTGINPSTFTATYANITAPLFPTGIINFGAPFIIDEFILEA